MSSGSLLNRSLQKEIMIAVRGSYPEFKKLKDICPDANRHVFSFNVGYLEDHGLIQVKWVDSLRRIEPAQACITAKGIDFLEDDGGLSAILGVVTVKLHEDTIKQLLIQKIEQSGKPKSVRDRLIDQVKNLPAELTKKVMLEAFQSGIDHLPDIADWLGKQLGS